MKYLNSEALIIWPISNTANVSPSPTDATPGAWLNDLDYGINSTGYEYRCLKGVRDQIEYLNSEILSDVFTFDKYPITDSLKLEPVDLDINSNRFAREFRTMIRQDLEEKGVNFAGHYSIVSVGLTGTGDNHYIVDRSNGKAYTFLYQPGMLDFKKDSNLIIMNPKSYYMKRLQESKAYDEYCDPRVYSEYADIGARSFYFLWKDNRLQLLGPTNIKPPINTFWTWYFKN